MTAIEAALSGLVDYAGLYPPASLDMRTAVHNYLRYRAGARSALLGRFIVDVARLGELREAAAGRLSSMPLSMIAPAEIVSGTLQALLRDGFAIEAVEIKCADPRAIEEISGRLPPHIERYFEIPLQPISTEVLDALASTRSRAKLRMGGIVPEAFPASKPTALLLKELAGRQLPFKATAGLHHPIRSRHRLTYEPDSSAATMHGFLNVVCAAALLHFGGTAGEALKTLDEEDSGAFQVDADAIRCRAFRWTAAQLRDARGFFTSFGSCSFTEPVSDLETIGWLK